VSETIEIAPSTTLVASYREQKMEWNQCLSEFIDNSFDARAKRVEIIIQGKRLTIGDDGDGMRDITAAVQLGNHTEHRHKSAKMAVGMYGVGAKGAAIRLSDRMQIETVHHGKASSLSVDWAQLEKSGSWRIAAPSVRDAAGEPSGTVITCDPILPDRSTPRDATWRDLGLTFMPALTSGLQVVFQVNGKRRLIIPAEIPLMSECVEDEFEIDGKQVRIRIGIRQDNAEVTFEKFALCYGHRCLCLTDIGTGTFNASRMTGRIDLGEGWRPNTYKDGLNGLDVLADPIFERIKPLLEKADTMARVVHCDKIRSEVESVVNENLKLGHVREKRPGEKGQKEGTSKPAATGGRRKNATAYDPLSTGSVEITGDPAGKPNKAVVLHFKNGDGRLIGDCSFHGKTAKVTLDMSHETVREAVETSNHMALMHLMTTLLSHQDDLQTDASQRRLFAKGDFLESFSKALKLFTSKGDSK